MKKKLLIMACTLFMCANVFAQNVTFNGYWEAPNGWIFLFKERIQVIANPDGSYMGGTGGFAANARQFTIQLRGLNTTNTYTFDYTVIDSGSIRVTAIGGNEWANGIWRKRTNIPGTTLNHRIIGYWEGRDGDTTRILYFAGDDIVPVIDISYFGRDYVGQTRKQYGWAYSFDRENNLVSLNPILFSGGDSIFYGFDYGPFPIRFDGNDLLVQSVMMGTTPNTETRFVRK